MDKMPECSQARIVFFVFYLRRMEKSMVDDIYKIQLSHHKDMESLRRKIVDQTRWLREED